MYNSQLRSHIKDFAISNLIEFQLKSSVSAYKGHRSLKQSRIQFACAKKKLSYADNNKYS